jgi:hypothetical protein
MNINDFVNSIQLQLHDFERMGGSEGKQDKIIRNISKVTTIREKGLTSST